MNTIEELAAKVESLTERVAMLERVILAVAKGLSAPPRRRWRTAADDAPAAEPPEPVRPSIVILPPQETAEAAERMAATVRRIIESTSAGGPT